MFVDPDRGAARNQRLEDAAGDDRVPVFVLAYAASWVVFHLARLVWA